MRSNKSIKCFFECLIPETVCNLNCTYCYVAQENRRTMKIAEMKYTPQHIGKCLTVKRLGGVCFFSICGAGETLMQPETIEISYELLKQGHFVNITTNGTLTKKFEELKKFPKEYLERLHFSFSLHYLELKKMNLLEIFFANIKLVHDLGCSYMVQINLCDEYIPYIDEIKSVCLKNVGALPQVAATRKEIKGSTKNVELYTNLTLDEYVEIGKSFDSPLFNYTMKNFKKKRKEFCYAGERSFSLNLSDGKLKKCYCDQFAQYIFDNPNSEIRFEAIGKNCDEIYCFNSSHFMSLGVIDNDDAETYCSLRDRNGKGWFNSKTKEFLSHKLNENNVSYGLVKRNIITLKIKFMFTFAKIKKKLKRFIKNIFYSIGMKGEIIK